MCIAERVQWSKPLLAEFKAAVYCGPYVAMMFRVEHNRATNLWIYLITADEMAPQRMRMLRESLQRRTISNRLE